MLVPGSMTTVSSSGETPRAALGAFYTPRILAIWVAEQLRAHVASDKNPVSLFDPACGDGALLAAAAEVFGREASLTGWDVDPNAVQQARGTLPSTADVLVQDSLAPENNDAYLRLRPDGVIVNPPWGAQLRQSPEILRASGLELASGQFDSYELFLERLIKAFPDGCIMAFILPDSILLPEHEPARRLLLERTNLRLVARIGEGFFPDVYRGTVVIVTKTGAPDSQNIVECFRLEPAQRRRIFKGELALREAQLAAQHYVHQSRFALNPHVELNLDLHENESLVGKISSVSRLAWDDWLKVGRGVEIGKVGNTVVCSSCGVSRVIPRRVWTTTVCRKCGHHIDASSAERRQIVRPITSCEDASPDWQVLITGEDVGRYSLRMRREILSGVRGIRYKSAPSLGTERLLVRKTGIGLHVAVDNSQSLTTQTVFDITLKDGTPGFVLHYLAGVLNSRVMLAFYLKWYGETEWRSHPYVTPKVLKELPVPSPWHNEYSLGLAKEIATAVRAILQQNAPGEDVDFALDMRVERLVANLYNLDETECTRVSAILSSAQPLQAIRKLRLPDPRLLYPHVDDWNIS